MGLIFSFSSVVGAFGDFLLSRYLSKVSFRRLFIVMFVVCVLFATTLFGANHLMIYLLAMGFWGIYWDVMGFGVFDFVGRYTQKSEHAQSFGIIDIFRSVGSLLAPIIAGILVVELVDHKPFIAGLVFLSIALYFYVLLVKNTRRAVFETTNQMKEKSLIRELKLWIRLGKVILPVVVLVIFMSCHDAFFLTLGPLISESLSSIKPFGGLFLTAYFLPTMFAGLFVGKITNRFGKKRTAFIAIFVGSIILSTMGFATNPLVIIGIVFLSAVLTSIAWPSIHGAFADYISEAPVQEAEIEGLGDLAFNIGYIIGPATAGFLADRVGNMSTFSVLGIVGIVLSLILLKTTPKHIRVPNNANVN
jgi:MFS family permease